MSRQRLSYSPIKSTPGNQTVSRLLMVLGIIIPLVLPNANTRGDDAVTQPYQIETWQVEDGLPQSSITSIVQSREGYLWLGTFNGLVRFDGMRFKVFSPNTAPSLPSGRIVQVFSDYNRALWIGTEEGAL